MPGYEVVISDHSSKSFMNPEWKPCLRIRMLSCKIVHGHIMNLIDKGVKFIFYPCIPYEHKEDERLTITTIVQSSLLIRK